MLQIQSKENATLTFGAFTGCLWHVSLRPVATPARTSISLAITRYSIFTQSELSICSALPHTSSLLLCWANCSERKGCQEGRGKCEEWKVRALAQDQRWPRGAGSWLQGQGVRRKDGTLNLRTRWIWLLNLITIRVRMTTELVLCRCI